MQASRIEPEVLNEQYSIFRESLLIAWINVKGICIMQ